MRKFSTMTAVLACAVGFGVFSPLLFGSAASAQMHQDSEGRWVNSAGGNLYGDSNINPDADPNINSDADPNINSDADPKLNSDADPNINSDADPNISTDGDPRYSKRDGDSYDDPYDDRN